MKNVLPGCMPLCVRMIPFGIDGLDSDRPDSATRPTRVELDSASALGAPPRVYKDHHHPPHWYPQTDGQKDHDEVATTPNGAVGLSRHLPLASSAPLRRDLEASPHGISPRQEPAGHKPGTCKRV
jgi:hypothetical protein